MYRLGSNVVKAEKQILQLSFPLMLGKTGYTLIGKRTEMTILNRWVGGKSKWGRGI
jgi:hypothetical protein